MSDSLLETDGSVEKEIVLTPEFEHALTILRGGGNLFLTGKAGTGKSTLIRRYIAESEDRRVLVAAPTGIAALNVGGYTIHRLFSFLPTTSLADVTSGTYRPLRFYKTLKSLETLIIDEASMVRADMFDKISAALERFGPRPGTPFGGVQVVLVGDLLQLPPVVTPGEEAHIAERYVTPYFFSADTFEREDFPTVALTTVFRQLGDTRMTSILNAVREGVLLEHAQLELNARTDANFEPPETEFWLTLAPTNSIVTARNRQRLERLPGDEYVHEAEETGDLSLFDPPVDRKLTFKVGAQIMMLSNDPADRWVNGTLGRILEVAHSEGELQLIVEFRDGTTVAVWPYKWEATRPVVEDGSLRHEVVGTYTQLPFKLAWAITIHKSQGQTLDRVIVDLSGGAFDFGQVYVALSRCTSMDGLVLTRPVLPRDLRTDRRIIRFLQESAGGNEPRRHCAVGILTVGDEGRMSQPRPVEIAVAFDDGTALSTLINPQRDLADARDAYGITVTDVLLAPTLTEAWSVFGPILEGATPVGINTDHALGLVDYELKRLGRVLPLPLGADLPAGELLPHERHGLAARSALERARTALSAHTRLSVQDRAASVFSPYDEPDSGSSYLLTRDPAESPPASEHLPILSELVDISRQISASLLHGKSAADVRRDIRSAGTRTDALSARELIASRLTRVASRASGVPGELILRLGEAAELLGLDVAGLLPEPAHGSHAIDDVLVPGARVCLTGTPMSPSGVKVPKQDVEAMLAAHGLVPVPSMTKTKCDVLVVAEIGTQSNKARDAVKFGKPVVSMDDVFAWLARRV